MTTQAILDLPASMSSLAATARARVERLFDITADVGRLVVPDTLAPKIARWYAAPGDAGPRDAIERAAQQRVVRVVNRVTGESALFNELRARRPMQHGETADLDARIDAARNGCDFCDPIAMTTTDTWGRVRGAHGVSAANASVYDAHHGMVVFGEHHPHRFEAPHVRDYLDVAMQWLRRTHEQDAALRHPFIMWNCLEKAGASQPHGHLQMLLARSCPYARQAGLVRAAEAYRRETGAAYASDWIDAHRDLGLAAERRGVVCAASLTPIKEKETLVAGPALDGDFADALAAVLRCFIDRLGVVSFNVGIFLPPMDADAAYDLPVIARCVDRGDPARPTADVGAMELYGTPVVASDPYRVIDAVRATLAAAV